MGISKITENADFLASFPTLTREQCAQLEMFAQLVLDWNVRINLISRKDTESLRTHHIVHSLAPLHYFVFTQGLTVLDLGTGGGFPGIPLAIACPNVRFHLVDSIAKKVRAVDDMVTQLQLRNVRVSCLRAEKLTDKYDLVVTRGVSELQKLWLWAAPLLNDKAAHKPSGLIAYKGFPFEEEIQLNAVQKTIIPLAGLFPDLFFNTKCLVHLKKKIGL